MSIMGQSRNDSAIISLGSTFDTDSAVLFRQERYLAKIQEEEEEVTVVYQIREELMQRVMEEIQESYLKSQTVKLVVHCACKALLQILDLNFFFQYDYPLYYNDHPAWQPDQPGAPSPPDSWAGYRVPIKTREDVEAKQQIFSDMLHSAAPSVELYTSASKGFLTAEQASSKAGSAYSGSTARGESSAAVSEESFNQEEQSSTSDVEEDVKLPSLFSKTLLSPSVPLQLSGLVILPEIMEPGASISTRPSRAQRPSTLKATPTSAVKSITLPPLRAEAALKTKPPVDSSKKKKKRK